MRCDAWSGASNAPCARSRLGRVSATAAPENFEASRQGEVLLSIVTIVRNDSPGLARTRASIAAQVGACDFEGLIVDGASNDGTAPLAQGFQEPYASVVSEADHASFDAMNNG